MHRRTLLTAAFFSLLLTLLPAQATIEKTPWGAGPDKQPLSLYTLRNGQGMVARISTYGAILVGLDVPDRNGETADVVQGFDSVEGYQKLGRVQGAVVGRVINRIENARFTLDGVTHVLPANHGKHNLHGGPNGFFSRVYQATPVDGPSPKLILHLVSPDGDQGFPGQLNFTVTYTLEPDNTLRVEYHATTDKPTVLNPSHHAYFNLKGAGKGTVMGHALQIFADAYTVVNAEQIPTGEIRSVADSGYDFRRAKLIGKDIDAPDTTSGTVGFNINYVLRGPMGTMRAAARVVEPESGRVMAVWTTQPGMQLFVPEGGPPKPGKNQQQYVGRGAFCLETQHFVNSPNMPSFPSTQLRPGEVFYEATEFRFSSQK